MKSLLLLISFLIPFLLSAKNYDVSNLTNNDGLSNSSINIINQDSSGLLWFGTWDGLNLYNGREFKVYKPDPGNSQSISNNIIRNIIQEQKDIEWIATDRGINRFDRRKNSFERFFTDNGNQTIISENSFFIAKNSSNMIFAAIYDQGIFFFNAKTHQFKHLNDEFGHLLGDEVLRQVSSLFHQQLRKIDVVCRYGGEEFGILLTQVNADHAMSVAQKLRSTVETWQFPGVPQTVTISAGVAAHPEHGTTRDELVRAADSALYTAKQSGRNRICLASLARGQASC